MKLVSITRSFRPPTITRCSILSRRTRMTLRFPSTGRASITATRAGALRRRSQLSMARTDACVRTGKRRAGNAHESFSRNSMSAYRILGPGVSASGCGPAPSSAGDAALAQIALRGLTANYTTTVGKAAVANHSTSTRRIFLGNGRPLPLPSWIGSCPGSSVRWSRKGGEPRNSASSRRVSFSKLWWRFFAAGSASGSREAAILSIPAQVAALGWARADK
jgi:hypothetical protein